MFLLAKIVILVCFCQVASKTKIDLQDRVNHFLGSHGNALTYIMLVTFLLDYILNRY